MSLDFWALCPVLDKSLESHQDPREKKMHRESGKMFVSIVVSSVPLHSMGSHVPTQTTEGANQTGKRDVSDMTCVD